jgi:hypothetical protein
MAWCLIKHIDIFIFYLYETLRSMPIFGAVMVYKRFSQNCCNESVCASLEYYGDSSCWRCDLGFQIQTCIVTVETSSCRRRGLMQCDMVVLCIREHACLFTWIPSPHFSDTLTVYMHSFIFCGGSRGLLRGDEKAPEVEADDWRLPSTQAKNVNLGSSA